MKYRFTRLSENRKTGPISVITASAATCPPDCALRDKGCYAQHGAMVGNWRRVSSGGDTIKLVAQRLAEEGTPVWRYGDAGDLPGDGQTVDYGALWMLVDASVGRRGIAYTHHRSVAALDAIRQVNALGGLTINVSANSAAEADALRQEWPDLPIVAVLPMSVGPKGHRTPAGQRVVVCPAEYSRVTCSTCGAGSPLCARADRDYVIGFRAHGARRLTVSEIASAR